MSSSVLVTAAIISRKDGRYCITQRLSDAKNFPNDWEFNGGIFKPEKDKSLRDCLEREVYEELDIIIKAKNIFGEVDFTYKNGPHILLTGFYCDIISGGIRHIGVQDHKWVYPHEMKNYKFLDADYTFIKKLRGELISISNFY